MSLKLDKSFVVVYEFLNATISWTKVPVPLFYGTEVL